MNLPKVAYLTLWFPKPSETFIFREVVNLWKMGLPLKVYALYGELRDGLSPEMLSIPLERIDRLGAKALGSLPGDVGFWFKRKREICIRLFKTIPFRRWKSIEFGGENVLAFLYGFSLARRFMAESIDHIHAAWAMGPATAAWVASELTGIPFSFAGRAHDILPPDGALEEKTRAAKFIITNNMKNIGYLEDVAPSSKGKTFGIYNGLTLDKFVQAPVVMTPPYKLLTLGRFDRAKAFHILLYACKILRDDGLDFRLTLAGDGARRLQLKLLTRKLGLVNHVSFPGFVPQNRVSDLFFAADVFVMSCAIHKSGYRDGLPNVIMEALAHRLPVVSTDVWGIPEVIQDGVTGLLVQQHDPQSLAQGVITMLQNRERALTMATRGQELVLREFDQKKNHGKIFDLIVSRGQ